MSRPFCRCLSCVVIPTGHVFLLHCSAWIQPSASMNPLAVYITSAPRAIAIICLPGFISFPDEIIFNLSLTFSSTSIS